MAGLGLENGKIPDSALSASSSHNSYGADQGRLQAQSGSGGQGSWVPTASNQQQWFQVEFGDWTKVTRVAVQGRLNAAQWVTKFKLSYSYEGVFFKEYFEEVGQAKVKKKNVALSLIFNHCNNKQGTHISSLLHEVSVNWVYP